MLTAWGLPRSHQAALQDILCCYLPR
jgi:hypothetical protein